MKKIILILIALVMILSGCALVEEKKASSETEQSAVISPSDDENANVFNSDEINAIIDELKVTNTELKVDACDLSGVREANVKVDIGYDSGEITRDYYAYTNEYAQVVYVEASELIVQNDKAEHKDVNNDGRYCDDEAEVRGTERDNLDQGHIIADSLGGVGNAYNITPQDSNLNRNGLQYDMEEDIRNALNAGKSVTEFKAYITYPSENTQTPDHYYFTYKIDGETYYIDFENK